MAEVDLEPLLTTQQNHLALLYAQSDSIDSRALGLIASIIAVMIFIGQAALELVWWQWLLLLFPYVVSLMSAVVCLRPQPYVGVAVDLKRKPQYSTMSKTNLILQLLADTEYAITHNVKLIAGRRALLVRSFTWGLLGTLALLAVLLLQ